MNKTELVQRVRLMNWCEHINGKTLELTVIETVSLLSMVVVNVVPKEQLVIVEDVMSIWLCDNVQSFQHQPKLKFVEQYEHVYSSVPANCVCCHVVRNVRG